MATPSYEDRIRELTIERQKLDRTIQRNLKAAFVLSIVAAVLSVISLCALIWGQMQ